VEIRQPPFGCKTDRRPGGIRKGARERAPAAGWRALLAHLSRLVFLGAGLALASPATAIAAGEANPLVQDIGLSFLMAGLLCVIFIRLGIPQIAAFLVAGIIVGPELGAVTNKANIETIANLGLVLLLFVIGLEINVHKLFASGKTLILTGLLQFPLCVGFGFAAGWWLQKAGWAPLAGPYVPLYVGFTAAASSTLIVVKLLHEKFQLDTVVGRISLGVLIFQDIWAIVILALQPNMERPELGPVGFTFLGIGILAAVAVLIAKYLLPIAFRWIAKTPELILVAAIGWCFGVGALGSHMGTLLKWAGYPLPIQVSYEMGARIAGAAIAGLPYSHEIVTKIAVVRDFFVTLFFVALGMGIPRPESLDVLLFALALSVIALAARYLVFFPLMYFTGLDRRNSFVASTKLAQISEFCLVITYLGVVHRHVSQETVSAVIFAFVITALATSFLFQAGDALHDRLGGLLSRLGFRTPPAAGHGPEEDSSYAVAMLGFHRVASSLLYEIERTNPDLLKQVLVADFNVSLHPEIRRRGAIVKYADISNIESLLHLGVDHARIVVSTVPDDLLKGVDNLRLTQMARRANPSAIIMVNALRLGDVPKMYEAGADYVFLGRMDTAGNLMLALQAALNGEIEDFRASQEERFGAMDERSEVFP